MTVVDNAAALTPEPADDNQARAAAAARHKAQHDSEFRAFTEATYHTVERILRSWCWDRDAVQDALHEAYLHGRVQWSKIRDYTEPVAWVIKTARNKLLNEHDRLQRVTAMAPEELPPSDLPELADAWEVQETLRGWLQQLPPRHAEVFQMSREGFSNQEIALVLGLADISVRSYKTAAKRQLRELAEKAGYTDSDSRRRRGGIRGSR